MTIENTEGLMIDNPKNYKRAWKGRNFESITIISLSLRTDKTDADENSIYTYVSEDGTRYLFDRERASSAEAA